MDTTERHQKNFYNKAWKGDLYEVGIEPPYAGNFRRWLEAEIPDRVALALDIGCGSAFFTKDIGIHADRTIGLDIADEQLQRNREKYPEFEFRYQSLYKSLPFDENSVDFIWCSEVLEHLLDPKYALCEFYRVLKPGGKCLLTVPYHALFKNVMIALFKWEHHFDPEYPHYQFFTPQTLGRLAQKCGFEISSSTSCGMGKPFRDVLIPTNILLSLTKS